jgi:hypothetical protein
MAKTKAQRRNAKRKQYVKERNVYNNQAKARYRLDVLFEDSGWKVMAEFQSTKQCEAYVAEQERIREEGKVEIIQGRIVEIKSGKIAYVIMPSLPEDIQSIHAAKKADPKGFMSDIKSVKSEKV